MQTSPATYAEALLAVQRAKKLNRAAARRFFEVVRRDKHTAWIPEILKRFQILLDQARGRTRVRLTGARREAKRFIPHLRKKFGRRAVIEFALDPIIIGGIVLDINDEIVIDASVRRQLDRMFMK